MDEDNIKTEQVEQDAPVATDDSATNTDSHPGTQEAPIYEDL